MKSFNLTAILIGVVFSYNVIAAPPKTSRNEFWWAFGHPFAALKVKSCYKKATPFYNENELKKELDAFSSGGKLDAFRHVFYMAAFAQKVKPKKLRKLGKAHEKSNYRQFKKNREENGVLPDSLSGVMDLLNNEIGIKFGSENKKMSLEELKQKVLILVKEEKAYYFLIDKEGRFLDCTNHVLDLTPYKGKWFVPKCLLGYRFMLEIQ